MSSEYPKYVGKYNLQQELENDLNLNCAKAIGLEVRTDMYPVEEGSPPDFEHIVDTVDKFPRYMLVDSWKQDKWKAWSPSQNYEQAHRVRQVACALDNGEELYAQRLLKVKSPHPKDWETWKNATDFFLFLGNTATPTQIAFAAVSVLNVHSKRQDNPQT